MKHAPAWSVDEQQLLDRCRQYDGPCDAQLGDELLTLIEVVFKRAHHKKGNLRKSAELVRALRLCVRESLFLPGRTQTSARVKLMLEVLSGCPQRPVLAEAALVLLVLQRRERWAEIPALEALYTRTLPAVVEWVLPLFVLELALHPKQQQQIAQKIRKMSFGDRRLRLEELVSVVDCFEGEQAILEELISTMYESIFAGVEVMTQKRQLAGRLFKVLKEQSSVSRHERWRLLVDPMIAQNVNDEHVMGLLLSLMHRMEPHQASDYCHVYMAQPKWLWTDVFWDVVVQKGDRTLLPKLYPITQRKVLGVKLGEARRAERAVDAIMAREGMTMEMVGSLTVTAQHEGGQLSVVRAQQGALSLREGDINGVDRPVSFWAKLRWWWRNLWR